MNFNTLRILSLKLKAWRLLTFYQFYHWLFQWNVDDEGDIVFSFADVLHFIKYKEHTIVKFGKQDYEDAPKYVKACK